MKTKIFIYISLLLLYFCNTCNNMVVAQEKSATDNILKVTCSSDLYVLTSELVNEFGKLNPEITLKLEKIKAASLQDNPGDDSEIRILTATEYANLKTKGLWKMEIAKDPLVPVINSKNPFLNELEKLNISEVVLAQMTKAPEIRNWSIIPKTDKSHKMNYYLVNDLADEALIADFLSVNQSVKGITVASYDKLAEAIQQDPYAIGFCRLSSLINSTNQHIDKGITIMPLDKNGNNKIDDFENTYSDLSSFMRKAWIGHFPKQLCGNIYSVASEKPANKAEIEFLAFLNTNGQKLLNENGYASLVSDETETNLAMLGQQKQAISEASESSFFAKVAAFFGSISLSLYLFAALIIALTVFGFVMNRKSSVHSFSKLQAQNAGIFDENSLIIPTGLYFDKTHTWAFMEKDGNVRIGIDDFIQHVTGPLTKVNMKSPGEFVKKGEPVMAIMQNGKKLCINSPVSGKIIEQNELLDTDPQTLNQSPYAKGWVYMIEPSNWLREIQFFSMTDKYREWVKNEFARLKDFFAITLQSKTPAYAYVLQDGGEIKDNVLAELGPDVWEEFQTNFVDTMK